MISYHRLGKFFKCSEPDYIFWPTGQKIEPHYCKKIDSDTKDYMPTADGENSFKNSWIAGIKLQQWFRKARFAFKLNDVGRETGSCGSSVVKVTPKGNDEYDVYPCNLLNLWFDPTIEWICDSPIIELFELTEMQIKTKKGWKDVDKALKKAEKVDNGSSETKASNPANLVIERYKIWQRVGEWQETDAQGKPKGEMKYWNKIYCGYAEDEVILFEEEIKKEKCPYIDFHIGEYQDRWLRLGMYEKLFGVTKLINELVNYNQQNNAIAALILFGSKDKALIGRDLLKEVITGQVFDTNNLSQIGITNNYLNEFLAQLAAFEKLAYEICMTPDNIIGETPPSGVPVRNQIMSVNSANDAFDDPRDRIGFRWTEVLLNWILPPLMAKWNDEETLSVTANIKNAAIFDYYYLPDELNEFVADQWAQDINPHPEEIEAEKERVLTRWNVEGRVVKNLKGFFSSTFGLKFNPTGENMNKEQKNKVYESAIDMESANPAITQSPRYQQYMEDNGITPLPMTLEQQTAVAQMGGGSARKERGGQDKIMAQLEQ